EEPVVPDHQRNRLVPQVERRAILRRHLEAQRPRPEPQQQTERPENCELPPCERMDTNGWCGLGGGRHAAVLREKSRSAKQECRGARGARANAERRTLNAEL